MFALHQAIDSRLTRGCSKAASHGFHSFNCLILSALSFLVSLSAFLAHNSDQQQRLTTLLLLIHAVQVHQTTDPDGGWPLEVVGEDDVVREVYLQPGEMVLYEGKPPQLGQQAAQLLISGARNLTLTLTLTLLISGARNLTLTLTLTLLISGARLLHGRPMRFKGEHFGNIFTHFKPNQYYDADDL